MRNNYDDYELEYEENDNRNSQNNKNKGKKNFITTKNTKKLKNKVK